MTCVDLKGLGRKQKKNELRKKLIRDYLGMLIDHRLGVRPLQKTN